MNTQDLDKMQSELLHQIIQLHNQIVELKQQGQEVPRYKFSILNIKRKQYESQKRIQVLEA